jgi:diguanylate cyclase (GGDEF)-like protein
MALRLTGGDLEARVALDQFGVSELKVLGETLNKAVEQIQIRDSKLEQMTLSDPLTGLANRRCFDKALLREWFRAGPSGASLAVLMVDVDFFKLYNDTYGHLAGDECLRRVAQAVSSEAQSTLDVTARFGGEEIALLAPNIDRAKAFDLAERVVIAVRRLEISHAASPLRSVTVSVGLAVGTPGSLGEKPETLVQAADQALYEAKRSGRNCAAWALSADPALQVA